VSIDHARRQILRATSLLASGLDAKVTAEGVDQGELLDLLRLAGVTEFQGYHFFKPLCAEDVSRLLERQSADSASAA
jgi:EAL domain-containing protein (putative c-di-GMP-specific phosphodiesterase class I)